MAMMLLAISIRCYSKIYSLSDTESVGERTEVKHGGLPFQLQPELATKFFRLIYSLKLNMAIKALHFHDNSNTYPAEWWWIQTTPMA